MNPSKIVVSYMTNRRLYKPRRLHKLIQKPIVDKTIWHDWTIYSTIQAPTTKQAYTRSHFKRRSSTKQSNMTKQYNRLYKPSRLTKLTLEVNSKTDRDKTVQHDEKI